MNTEWVWWFLALLLAGGGLVGFLALGRVPEIEDEPAEETTGPDRADDPAARWDAADGSAYNAPVSTTVPGPDVPSSTSDTP
jgi:hypothetical protein